jgi:hypothetical protein
MDARLEPRQRPIDMRDRNPVLRLLMSGKTAFRADKGH